jgi:hypothetical protein
MDPRFRGDDGIRIGAQSPITGYWSLFTDACRRRLQAVDASVMRPGALAALAVMCGIATAAAEEFHFLGPMPARNFQPIQLIFLNLPFERAATLPPETLAFDLQSAESNVVATTQGGTESLLKFESNRTVIGFRLGVAPGWEAGVAFPFISRFGGFLDPIIDEVEKLFGRENPERSFWPDNTFAGFSVVRGDTTLFQGQKEQFQLSDLWLSAKRELRLAEGAPMLALRAAIKLPTGSLDRVTGSGKPDFGLGMALDYLLFRRLMLYCNLNMVYPVGPLTDARLTLDPIFTQSFAAELALGRTVSAVLHQAAYSSPFHGTQTALLNNGAVELGLGLNWAVHPALGLQLLAIQNVSGVESAADFSVLLAASVRSVTSDK